MNFVEPGFVDNGYFIRDNDTQGDFRFDGLGRKVFVNDGVVAMTIDDLFSRWEDWLLQDDNFKWLPAMRYSGKDPIPGGETGTTFFLMNNWKLVYDPAATAVSGVLYSENFDTAYWGATGLPIYPATVSALVNSVTMEGLAAQVLALLQATTLPVNLTKVRGQDLTGVGSELSPWGPA